ncbi:ParA family protein [Candidatus Bandiella euplotis]|uniref:Chromosome partitioning protein ParA n=1 Tax=Candidatus Bandiella euplotis TaxID=1664265 RepID=A0ABZ0UM11_9RICK|nr:ParA family protein [Candidatus Bandiella woodruffii]WPX97193.1 Chromosome partitioning protein ParA [Candidatus Bandiella woodruffii]
MKKITKIISIINQKGGVGKTTTSINLPAALSMFNKKMLLIDFDPQGNLSTGIGVNEQDQENTIYSILTSANEDINNVIKKTLVPNIEIIAANQDLAVFDIEVVNIKDKEYLLHTKLKEIQGKYDYVFIDCAPSLSQLTINALTASDAVLIPLQCEFFALEGVANILKIIDSVKANLNPNLSIEGILLTMYDRRNRLCKEIVEDVRKNFGAIVYDQVIPRNIKLSEASSYGKPVILYDSNCSGSIAYMLLAQEMLAKQVYIQ